MSFLPSVLLTLANLMLFTGCAGVQTQHCKDQRTSIVVVGKESTLHLCQDDKSVDTFRVAFGQNGIGKTKPGDKKTPLGSFPLGAPRASADGFHLFVPIIIPSAMGSAVGIHGPTRSTRFLGPANVAIDWTLGCIAVSSDSAITSISDFVKKERPRLIHILN